MRAQTNNELNPLHCTTLRIADTKRINLIYYIKLMHCWHGHANPMMIFNSAYQYKMKVNIVFEIFHAKWEQKKERAIIELFFWASAEPAGVVIQLQGRENTRRCLPVLLRAIRPNLFTIITYTDVFLSIRTPLKDSELNEFGERENLAHFDILRDINCIFTNPVYAGGGVMLDRKPFLSFIRNNPIWKRVRVISLTLSWARVAIHYSWCPTRRE